MANISSISGVGIPTGGQQDPTQSAAQAASSTPRPHAVDPETPPHTTIIAQDGDLYIALPRSQRLFRVDSRAMIRASPKWKAELGPGGEWSESRPAHGAWIVVLPYNNRPTMKHLLDIIHHNTRQVPEPKDLTLSEIFKLAKAVGYNKLRGCLGFHIDKWCDQDLCFKALSEEGVRPFVKLAWIGWVFGRLGLFEYALNRMASMLQIQVDDDGLAKLVDHLGAPLQDEKLASAMEMDIVEHLTISRNIVIADMLNNIGAIFQRVRSRNPSFCRLRPDQAGRSREACDTAISDSLTWGLADESLIPFPTEPDAVEISVDALIDRIISATEKIKPLGVGRHSSLPGLSVVEHDIHANCGPQVEIWLELAACIARRHDQCKGTPAHWRHIEQMRREFQDRE